MKCSTGSCHILLGALSSPWVSSDSMWGVIFWAGVAWKPYLTLSFIVSFASSPLSWDVTRHLTFRRNAEHTLRERVPIKWSCLTFPAERSKPRSRKDQWLLPKILVALRGFPRRQKRHFTHERKGEWSPVTFAHFLKTWKTTDEKTSQKSSHKSVFLK